MRKLLLIIVAFVLTFSLVGCQGPDIVNDGDTVIEYDGEPVYTKEQVDLMLEEQMELMQDVIWEIEDDVYSYRNELETWCEDVWLDVPDETMNSNEYYANYDCVDMLEWYGENWEELYYLMLNFDRLEDNLYTKEELDEGFEDLLIYLQENYYTIEQIDMIFEYYSNENVEYESDLLNYRDTIARYSPHTDRVMTMTIVVEDGWITQMFACGDYCESMLDENYEQTEPLYDSDLESLKNDLQNTFDIWYEFIENNY